MRVETLCTGDELLTGLTADTNSRFFQELLLDRTGLTVRRGAVVGDNRDDIIASLKEAASRADVLLVSGGLGPTADDITALCAAEALGVPLEERAEVWAHITQRFARRNVMLTQNNRRQAMVPQGAEVHLNAEGSAPLFIVQVLRCQCFFVPGVPREYRHLVETHVVPRIEARHRQAGGAFRVLKCLRTMGIPESHLDERVQPVMARHPRVTFGFRTHAPENQLKLLAEGSSRAEAETALAAAEADSRTVLGEAVFGVDEQSLPDVVVDALRAEGATLATAESLTSGRVAALLTDIAGASAVYVGGGATYKESAKTTLARVPPELLAAHGAVSAPVAKAMAEGIRAQLGTTWGVSTTGFAGPGGGTTEHPVGTVFIAVAGPSTTTVQQHFFHGDRSRVRAFAAMTALDDVRRRLEIP